MEHYDALSIVVLIFGTIAASCLIASSIPLTNVLVKTRQTHSLSLAFSGLLILSGLIWVIYAILNIEKFWNISVAADPNSVELLLKNILGFFPMLIMNFIVFVTHSINVAIKLNMMMKAKKKNMTEKEYCDLVYAQKQGK